MHAPVAHAVARVQSDPRFFVADISTNDSSLL